MSKKIKIIVINNIYHAEMFGFLDLISSDSVVYCHPDVALSIDCNRRDIPEKISLKRNMITRLLTMKSVRNWILRETQDLYVDTIILGSDKELFNQVLLSTYPNVKVCLFDEGIGFYRSLQKWSRWKNIAYKLLSASLLGIKIEFVQPLGSHRLVNEIYIRRYDLLGHHRDDIEYRDLPVRQGIGPCLNLKNVILLILPWDLNDKGLVSKVVHTIWFILDNCEDDLELKPHPSDVSDWSRISFGMDDHRVKVLDRDIRAELLYFDSYKYIINFRSSSILDYLFNGGVTYIITVSLDPGHIVDDIYPNIVYYRDKERIREYIKLGNKKYNEFIQRRQSDIPKSL